jgi:predicted phosphodiesterase
MDRREFLRVSGVAAAAGVVGVSAEAAPAPVADTAKPFGLASAPVLVNPAPDGVTVVCALKGPGTGWVEIGETGALGRRVDGGQGGLLPYSDSLLSVRVTGLKPGTKYFYRVHACPVNFKGPYSIKRGEELRSEVGSFTTLDPKAGQASFMVWNDTHETIPTLQGVIGALRERPADFLMWNGDVTNDVTDEAKVIANYLYPAGQAFADRVPVFFGRGNHDIRGRYARRLPEYVSGPHGQYYYAFRQGPVAFIVMDTGEDKPDETPAYAGLGAFEAYRAEQTPWLERAIQDPAWTSATYRVAFLHIPLWWEAEVPERWTKLYGPGIIGWACEDGRAKWHDLLVRGKVDVVISGHTHKYAWFAPKEGRPYGQLIGGGPKVEEATTIEGRADGQKLEITMRKLGGEVVLKQEIRAKNA